MINLRRTDNSMAKNKRANKHAIVTKKRVDFRYSGKVGGSCCTSGNTGVACVTNPMISHERGK